MPAARFSDLLARALAAGRGRLAPLFGLWIGAAIAAASIALPAPLFAQDPAAGGATKAEVASETAPNADAREAILVAVLAARRQAEADLRTLQSELRSDAARGREDELELEVRTRAAELARLSRNFSELATGIDPLSLDSVAESVPFELTRELRVLLSPLINELKRATSRPREIDRLRTEVADLDDQLRTIERALAQLDAIREASTDETLTQALTTERRSWEVRRSAIEASLAVTDQKLVQQSAESRSIGETVHEVFGLFFKSRGRNLLLAIVATLSFLFLLRRIRAFLARRPRFVEREQTFHGRVFGLVYSVFSVVGAVIVFVVALYFFGDWVLLTLALLLLLGLIWASKQAVPRFWSQSVLILDMGAVREGQRVIWNGLPWRVESIGFYCVLENPALIGGLVRIPIDDLARLRSRPTDDDEPWFPTKAGDVVLLEDGRSAIIELQSTEVVRLQAPGGNRVFIPTAEFVSRRLEVLSHGYRVDLEFGLDYENRAGITTTDRDMMQAEVDRRWRESPWARSLVGVAVEFSRAGPSSLDYFVRVDLDGSQANEYAPQRRHLARICVDVCNENDWLIPFQQLTVHVAPPIEAREDRDA